jgi:oligoendopeptidase F
MLAITSPESIAKATWEDLEPAFDELLARPLDAGSVEPWLADWSRLEEIVGEAISTAMIRYTSDTADPVKEADHRRFVIEIAPKAEEKSVKLARRFVELGYRRPGLEQMTARFSRASEIFREANVPLMAALEEAGAEYQRITGGFLADWEGEKRPLPQLAPFLQSPARAVRERAFRATVAPYVAAHDQLADLFDRQFALRVRVAANAGFPDYQAYAFASKCRFDYRPEDCARFHRAVERVAAPAVARLQAHRRERLDLDRLRPWDLGVSLYRDQPLRPFSTAEELARKALRIFDHLDPALADQFRTMIEERLLDLDSRKNKAPGGYCDTLHFRGRPFIFMNAAGVMDDVQTLLHEAGHAFHAFSADRQPLIWQRHPSAESAELASMSMELMAAPLLDAPGAYLDAPDAAIARLEHLEDVLVTLGHVASIDAFQSWLYTSGAGGDRDARDRAWLEIRARFEPGVDWSDLTAERIARWYRQLHIFLYPFYYIEYGLAQLGAVQVWLAHRRDPGRALADYRQFLSLGATASLPDLYRTAGATLVFDAEEMSQLVDAVEAEIGRLRATLS